MKARLRTGQPIGQYLKPTQRHGALYLCTCASCGVEGSLVITADGQQTAGRYFYSFLDVSKHWREQENAERLMNNIGVLTSNHTLPIPHSAAVPISTVLETPATFLDIPRASTIACVPVLPVSDDDGEAEAKPSSNVSFEWQEVIATRARLNRAIEHAGWDPTDVDFIGETTVDLPEISDPIQLLAASSANSYVEGHLEWLFRTIQEIRGYSDSLPCFKETRFRLEHQLVCHMLEQELTSTRQKLRDEWKRRVQIFELGQERIQSSGVAYHDIEPSQQSYFVMLFAAAVLHLLCNLSMLPISFFLGSMRIVSGIHGSPYKEIRQQIPIDIRTVVERLNLQPKYTAYVCCPKCFTLYDLDNCPDLCSNKAAPGDKMSCGRKLQTERRNHSQKSPPAFRPVRTFNSQSLKDWIAWMHSRSELEPYLEKSWNPQPPANGVVSDIWESKYLREFCGLDGKPFLSPDLPNENRLIFNLNADGFNPYGNRTAGKKVSIGGIYLVCLNLPPSLRHKPENTFLVGIIPGPKEPSAHQINYLLRPIVDELEVLWSTGIYINRTRLHPRGRSVRAALVALVCDMPAARLLGGFAHFSRLDCSCSMCKHSDLNNLDERSFTFRTDKEHRRMAQAWLDADTQEERDRLFAKNGVRWSELLRLKYWDPVRNTVIDPMHGFYLRIFQRHCRDIWGMGVKLEDSDGIWDMQELSDELKNRAQTILKTGTQAALKGLPVASLRYLATFSGVDNHRKKSALHHSLLSYRVKMGWFDSKQIPIKQTGIPSSSPSVTVTAHTPITPINLLPVTTLGTSDSNPPLTNAFNPTSIEDARREYQYGHQKSMLLKFTSSVLQSLVKENNITVLTPSGKASKSKKLIVDALVEERDRRKQTAGNNAAPSLPFPGPSTSATGTLSLPPQSLLPYPSFSHTDIAASNENHLDNELALELYKKAPKSKINSLGWRKLRVLCAFIRQTKNTTSGNTVMEEITQIKPTEVERENMKQYIHQQRFELGITDEAGRMIKRKDKSKKVAGVLGKATLAEVRTDMERLRLPSWAPTAPSNPGDTTHGKFTADQWRAFCTVNLPITLIRLWGSLPEENRKFKMLENFMFLVTAVRLANMRTITEGQIQDFEQNIRAYLEQLRILYPHTNITVYQHMMLHFGSLLRRFGPVHSWRCFPFERYNYILQNTPNNSHLGELETTLFIRFCNAQRLKSVLNADKLPQYLNDLACLYKTYFENTDRRGSRISDALAFNELSESDNVDWDSKSLKRLEVKHFKALQIWVNRYSNTPGTLQSFTMIRDRVQWQDLTFTSQTTSFRDSQVVVNLTALPGNWSAGSIHKMFTVRWLTTDERYVTRTFAEINLYQPLEGDDLLYDNYRRFGFAGGKLFHRSGSQDTILLPLELIACHFGYSALRVPSIDTEVMHALPLPKSLNI